MKTTAAIFCLVLVTTLLVVSHARQIQFTNECPFQLNVEATPGGVVCGLNQGASCTWQIPASGWSGNFHRQDNDGILGYPSATLAEFTLGSNAGGEWDWDWYDISIIPPGCGSGTSYDGCWCTTGRDGYDVGMTVQPLSPTGCETRTCLNRDCAGAYGYPSDSSKTTTCKDITGNWHITFCPPGSFIDVGATAVSQTPPCDGGSATPPATKSPPPPAKKITPSSCQKVTLFQEIQCRRRQFSLHPPLRHFLLSGSFRLLVPLVGSCSGGDWNPRHCWYRGGDDSSCFSHPPVVEV